ncbi:aminotransferase class V-fold PLP-dependent enzyme [Siccirubricoccus sp. KC 17139]|uniref:Cysteine desulfurase n=1 Tax=Siccirubricoccus soli TaxID=2899147 RepID=A0ABT1D6S6_9PROT|nr:aminotransferase class V-fold PLP-dependent enzyme [Siccirubricoccus soli]MCO6417642.1 aminotransferase class V-fold PLP-dependent enzyme [Siccirubricoccus soli]MCP2683777.1 aminotransferase class V-fold PLP-dependent enzyme [Siccirubricoccus soli]
MTLYMDANATEPLRPAARGAVLAALEAGGNPSSVHAAGRGARRLLEAAREAVAARFAPGFEVVFTAGGTEANALAIHGLGQGRRVLVGATEHPAVLAAAGPAATVLPVLADGTLDLAALEAVLAEGPPALVCAMAANNETGVRHPIAEVSALCRAHGALLHMDAVQAAGRGALPVGADSIALSGHKLGGPPGAGALLLRPGLHLPALIAGGGQERGKRGGTEPLPALAGMAAAVPEPGEAARLAALRDRIEAGLPGEGVIAGRGAPRLPNTSLILLPGVAAETQVIALDLAGVRVSAGAACSSGKVARSHVLAAMGFGELAGCGIRVSLPWNAPEDAAERFLEAWSAMRRRLSKSAA